MTAVKILVRLLSLVLVGFTALACQASAPSEKGAEVGKLVDIGMTLHFRGADVAAIGRQFDLMAAMDVTWVRIDIDWSAVESVQGQQDWSYPDTIVDQAVAHRMNVLLVLAYSPAWARSTATGGAAARPDRTADYGSFARTAAQRFAARGVHTWEIWNEPNSSKFWPPRPDANEYAELFRLTASAIRSVDPRATLLIGGLAPKYDASDTGISPADYLDELYGNGTAQLADGVAAHPYSFPALPSDSHQEMQGGFKDLPALHAVMDRHGDGRKRVWITEFGAPTGTGPNAVSEQAQAASLVEAREQVARWDWAGPLIYYELVDGGTDLGDIEQNFGVFRENLTPKPAATALLKARS